MNLAPIVLFVYNRPDHTLKTLEALFRNDLANESILYIYADGPKENADEEIRNRIKETRAVTKSKQWCKQVIIYEKEKNMGLADSIISGVTEIINKHQKIIVLEDDLVTSKGFLKYMNDALTLYESEEKVMHISGSIFPVKFSLPETYFYNTASCWGWGTWLRAWNNFNNNAQYLLSTIDNSGLRNKFNIEGSYDFYDQLKANIDGRLKTWAIRWYASFFLVQGLSLHPYPSLANNIGHDGMGENCGISSVFEWEELAIYISVKKIKLKENSRARKIIAQFNREKLSHFKP
jgi:GR25 family glycosyltransferase involved in LPS biosynthesis